MWSWLPAVIGSLMTVIKALFGIDKPQQVTTDEKPSPLPAPAPVDVLRDLGIASSATGSGDGFTPRVSADPRGDTLKLHAGSDGGGSPCADPPRSATPGFGERESQR